MIARTLQLNLHLGSIGENLYAIRIIQPINLTHAWQSVMHLHFSQHSSDRGHGHSSYLFTADLRRSSTVAIRRSSEAMPPAIDFRRPTACLLFNRRDRPRFSAAGTQRILGFS